MARRAGSHRARWLVACLAPAVLAACRVTDQRFLEPPAAPRLIAPSSLGRATVLKPRLVWTQGPGGGTAAVELCMDRACTTPIATPLSDVTVGSGGLRSAVPLEALPYGCVYWRVRVTAGDQEQVSPTWQFWIPHSANGTPIDVDTTSGVIFDVNGDGYADFLVGAAAAREPGVTGGRVHLYLGSGAPAAASWNGAVPAGRIDIVVPANVPIYAAISVAPVGDVNGDGFADFVVGSPFAVDGAGGKTGAASLYLGSAAPSADRWNGAAASDRIDLVSPEGEGGALGNPAVALGDVNRDGYADFLVGSSAFSGTQPAHVYLGTATPGDAAWTGAAAPRRIEVTDPDGVSSLLATAASAGDVNGDGYADFVVGTSGSSGEGAVHVYLGSAMPDRATWNGPSAGARIDITSLDGPTGKFSLVAGAGDVNGDGFSDLLVGAPQANSNVGAAHLFLGARDPAAAWTGATPARIDLSSPDATMSAFGTILASAGDVNSDGLSDFVVSGIGSNFGQPNAGTSHVYLGMLAPSPAAWNGVKPPQRVDLTAPEGTTSAYGDLPLANGDLNKDLYDDLAISAPEANGQVGAVYVYWGSASPSGLLWNGAAPTRRLTLTGPDAAGSEYGGMR